MDYKYEEDVIDLINQEDSNRFLPCPSSFSLSQPCAAPSPCVALASVAQALATPAPLPASRRSPPPHTHTPKGDRYTWYLGVGSIPRFSMGANAADMKALFDTLLADLHKQFQGVKEQFLVSSALLDVMVPNTCLPEGAAYRFILQ